MEGHLYIDATDKTSATMDITMHQIMRDGPGKKSFPFRDDGVAFSSRFDGGSMAHVDRVTANEFHVTLAEDAAESGISTGYTSWFYFEVMIDNQATSANAASEEAAETPETPVPASLPKGKPNPLGSTRELKILLKNMNNQRGLYANGYTVFQSVMDVQGGAVDDDLVELFFENERKWMRIATPISVEKYTQQPVKPSIGINGIRQENDDDDDGGGGGEQASGCPKKVETKMKLAFTYHTQFARERVRFAFCYPYTYTKVQRQVDAMHTKFSRPQSSSGSIYYHRDIITYSLGGLPIDLITISSRDWMLSHPEKSLPELYPENGPQERACAFDLTKKKTVFLTARVHPGETPANFMLDGMLQLLLHPTDDRAAALRRQFVFKIIPVLNPDGVCQGYYRTDTRGVNLNRVYENPQLAQEPAVYALKQLLLQTVERYGKEKAKESVVFLDLHAHANHRGGFVYGNSLLAMGKTSRTTATATDSSRQVQTQLYAKLASLHSPFFDYHACSFDAINMARRDARDNNNATTSREGSSRVALFRATDLTYVYTIECNYNEGRRRLENSTSSSKHATATTTPSANLQRHAIPLGSRLFHKLSPLEWADVGIGCVLALLDLFQCAPGRTSAVGSKAVADSPYRTLDGVKKSILSDLKAAEMLNKDCSSQVNRNPQTVMKGTSVLVKPATPQRTKSSSRL